MNLLCTVTNINEIRKRTQGDELLFTQLEKFE